MNEVIISESEEKPGYYNLCVRPPNTVPIFYLLSKEKVLELVKILMEAPKPNKP